MKRRIYLFSLLISAISGLVVFGVGMPKGHTVQSHIQTIPDAWLGTWEVTVAYRDHATGDLVVTNVITDEICPGEPIIPPELQVFARCSSQVSANEIGVSCQNRPRMIRDTGCDTFGAVELTSQRDGDSWSGTGSWSVSHVGNCTGTTKAEDFVVSGRRISTKAACDAEPSSLLQRFFVHSELVPFLEGRN